MRIFLALIFVILGWNVAAGIMLVWEMMLPSERRD
jgi:hypothetical protein